MADDFSEVPSSMLSDLSHDELIEEIVDELIGYDPLIEPDAAEWLALDEQTRIDLVEDFHEREDISIPGAKAHAVIHVVVENQIAEGDALPVKRTIERLMVEGLDRHDAIHAVGSLLIGHLSDLVRERKSGEPDGDPNAPYYAELEGLTAVKWQQSG